MMIDKMGITPKDALREQAYFALFHTFRKEGYPDEQCSKLAHLAIGIIHQSLQLSQQAYELYVEAIGSHVPMPIFIREDRQP